MLIIACNRHWIWSMWCMGGHAVCCKGRTQPSPLASRGRPGAWSWPCVGQGLRACSPLCMPSSGRPELGHVLLWSLKTVKWCPWWETWLSQHHWAVGNPHCLRTCGCPFTKSVIINQIKQPALLATGKSLLSRDIQTLTPR